MARARTAAKGGKAHARWTGIFARHPTPGEAKTRLCPPLSAENAARFAEASLRDVVTRLAADDSFATALLFTPPEQREWFVEGFPEVDAHDAQEGEGLGERLAAFFGDALGRKGVVSAVAVGSDVPMLRAEMVAEAHRRLENGADLVVGPDAGGGYTLIGLRAPHPELFTEVAMSSPEMCSDTVHLAETLGLSVALVAASYDIDVVADLERLRSDLYELRAAGLTERCPTHTTQLLDELFSGA